MLIDVAKLDRALDRTWRPVDHTFWPEILQVDL